MSPTQVEYPGQLFLGQAGRIENLFNGLAEPSERASHLVHNAAPAVNNVASACEEVGLNVATNYPHMPLGVSDDFGCYVEHVPSTPPAAELPGVSGVCRDLRQRYHQL